MKLRSSSKKVANGLVAVSSAAVLAVYAAGYTRTQSAADKLDGEGQAAGLRSAPRGGPSPGPTSAALPAIAALAATTSPTLPAPATPDVNNKSDKTLLVGSVKPKLAATLSTDAPAVSVPVAPAPVTSAAPAEDPAVTAAKAAALPPWKDGSYAGWGTCRHGDIEATVVIADGKIASATITQCLTRYSCDIIEKLPPQVSKRQSPEVDYVSGATQSAGAFYWAVVGALGKAK